MSLKVGTFFETQCIVSMFEIIVILAVEAVNKREVLPLGLDPN